jgi:hypothetical protein
MLLTQHQTYTCQCGQVYRGQEGVKHNARLGTERVVWKKVKVGKETLKLAVDGSFMCPICQQKVNV